MATIEITEQLVDSLNEQDAKIVLEAAQSGDATKLEGLSSEGAKAVLGGNSAQATAAETPPESIAGKMALAGGFAGGIAGGVGGTAFGLGIGGVPGAVGGAALGAAGGEAFGQLIDRFRGSADTPDTSSEAVEEIGEKAVEAAFAEAAGGAVFKAAKITMPVMAQTFGRIPRHAFIRALERPSVLKGFVLSLDDVGVAKKGMKAMRRVYEQYGLAKKFAGKQVDSALTSLNKKMGGRKAVNVSSVADDVDALFNDASLGDPAVFEAAKAADPAVSVVEKIADKLRNNPNLSIRELVDLRRQIDAATDFIGRPGQSSSSALSQQGFRLLGNRLRGLVAEAAEAHGDDALLLANRKYHKLLETGDELRSIAPMRDGTTESAIKSWEALAFKFQRGGARGEAIEALASRVPGAYNALNDAVDAAAAIHFVRPPLGTPSSLFKDMVRFMMSPQVVSAGIKAAPMVKQASRLGVLGATHAANPSSIITDEMRKRLGNAD